MHLVRFSIEGLPDGRAVALDFGAGDTVRTWTTLAGGRDGTATLVALAASIAPGRIASPLDSRARLTDPVRFLERISAKAHQLGTARQKQFLGRLCRALAAALEPDDRSARARGCPPTPCVSRWATRGFAFAQAWRCLHAWERRAACVIIDVARHAYDAFPCCESLFDQSAVLLLDRPDRYCPGTGLARFFSAITELLPRGQVVVSLGRAAREQVPRALAEDIERLRFLRSLPGAYVFMQRYQPIPGGPAPDVSRLFDDRPDAHLDELVRIVFSQNMKNVERYYRWLSVEYARQCGRIHRGLVDTLYRYNDRHRRGAFLQQLEETARARHEFS